MIKQNQNLKSVISLIPLMLAAGILLGGNGLQGTVITLRAIEEGFSTTQIGFIGMGYSAGFMTGCLAAPYLIREIGYIRSFSALAALAAASTIMMVLFISPITWIVLRFIMGICFASLFMVIESWFNEKVDNQNRARILSIYRIVDLIFVTGGQFMLPLFEIKEFPLFATMAIAFAISLIPVAVSDRTSPPRPKKLRINITELWKISPIACIGAFTVGMTNSSFRLVGPLYGNNIGLDNAGIALFMSAGIVGGAILQYPLGYLSDKYDRRKTLIIATTIAGLAGLFLSQIAGTNHTLIYSGALIFGAFAMPLYSLCAAHANDQAKEGNYVIIAAGLLLFFAAGASVGPPTSSMIIAIFGSTAFFTYISCVHLTLVVLTLYRMSKKPNVTIKTAYVALLRTSPIISKLAAHKKNVKNKSS